MILNTNNLPWFLSKDLRSIINYNISEFSKACVISFSDPNYSVDSDENYPVIIAVDTDGTLILICSYLYLDGPPFRNLLIKQSYNFIEQIATSFEMTIALKSVQKRFEIWERTFVETCMKGAYSIKTSSVAEVVLFK